MAGKFLSIKFPFGNVFVIFVVRSALDGSMFTCSQSSICQDSVQLKCTFIETFSFTLSVLKGNSTSHEWKSVHIFQINVFLFMADYTNLALNVLFQKICLPTSMERFPVWIPNPSRKFQLSSIQSNLDYPDSLRLDEIVQINEGLDNRKYEYQWKTKLIKFKKHHLITSSSWSS